ncbi:hypothetical protein OQ637_000578 [Escherichia coli]|nr:hypothetical protein [Escherichia coli]
MNKFNVDQNVVVTVNGVPGVPGVVIGYTVAKSTPVKYIIKYQTEDYENTDWFDESIVNEV